MINGLLFVCGSVFSWDYSKPDLGIGYPDNYSKTSFPEQEQKSRSTQIFLMESWGEIYTNTPICRILKNKKKLDEYRFEDFKIPNGLNDYYYVDFVNQPKEKYNFRQAYKAYVQNSHKRLLRLYALLGSEKRNSISANNNPVISNRCSPDPILDALIEKITWRLGTITQIKVMLYHILYFPELCQLYSLLKNRRDPCYAPFIDGNDCHTEPLNNEKTDIIYSLNNNDNTKFVHFHIGNRIETAQYFDFFFLKRLDIKGEYELPSSNTWIAVSRDGTTLITYDKDNNSLISIKDWYGKNVIKAELLNFSKNFNIRHGIFLNTTKIMLALTYRESLCNAVYDILTKKCWMLDGSSYYFQRFLIAGESEFPGYYIIGGFSADDMRYQQRRLISVSDDTNQQEFLDVSHSFSMRMFTLDEVDEITFQE